MESGQISAGMHGRCWRTWNSTGVLRRLFQTLHHTHSCILSGCDPSRNPWIASRILPTKGVAPGRAGTPAHRQQRALTARPAQYLNLHARWCLRQRYHHRERSTISPLADAGNRHVQISEPVYIRIRETVAATGSPNFGGCSGRPSWSVHAGRRCSVGRLARRGRMHRRRGCDASSLKMVGGWTITGSGSQTCAT